jgi:nitrous oxidase accessory protein NosD
MIYVYGDVVDPGLLVESCTFGNGTADQGIYVSGGASPQILNNFFAGFSDAAVNLASVYTPTVTGNTFESNTIGVHLVYTGNTAPTITNNTYLYNADGDVRVAGTINNDVAWNEDPGTVYLTENSLTIRENGHLSITDGIIVKVNPDGIVWIQSGVLDATGVTFTTADKNDEWDAIVFHGVGSQNRLENCVIERAKGRSTSGNAMVYSYMESPQIIGCTIGNGGALRGIYVAGGASPQILNNFFTGFSDAAVHLENAQTAIITGNTFESNTIGVHSRYGSYTAPTITNNTYQYNADGDVRVEGNLNNELAWNEDPGTVYLVSNNLTIKENGNLSITAGIIVKVNPNILFWMRPGGVLDAIEVTFTAADQINGWPGIQLSGDSRTRLQNCVIERANGLSNSDAMVYVYGGSPNIIGCKFGNSDAKRGVYVYGATPQILKNIISGFDYGIYMSPLYRSLVAGNTITENRIGIGFMSNPRDTLHRANRIENNIEYGIFNPSTSSTADARYNWWGSATGPTFIENPSGTGDAITTKVDYLPFFGSITDVEPDGIWDEWEIQNFTDTITATESSDFDNDGLLDAGEFLYGTDPKNSDSDGDGVFDGLEIQCFLNPLLSGDFGLDSDNDGFSDLRELISGTDQWDNMDIPEIIADGEPQPSSDGDVDGKDLTAFIAEIGSFNCSTCQFDLDYDGDVDRADLFLLTEDFGRIKKNI